MPVRSSTPMPQQQICRSGVRFRASAPTPVAGAPPRQTPPPAPFVAPVPERAQVYPQLRRGPKQSGYFRCSRDGCRRPGPSGRTMRRCAAGRTVLLGEAVGVAVPQPSLDGRPGCKGYGLACGCQNGAGCVETAVAGFCRSRRIVSRLLSKLSAAVRIGRHPRQFALGCRVHTQAARV